MQGNCISIFPCPSEGTIHGSLLSIHLINETTGLAFLGFDFMSIGNMWLKSAVYKMWYIHSYIMCHKIALMLVEHVLPNLHRKTIF